MCLLCSHQEFGIGQLGVSITWLEVWGGIAGQAAESHIQSRDGLVSFRLWYCWSFRVHPICQIKVNRNGLKFPKIHLTLSKHFHLLDLHFTSIFRVSSHSQILKPENFPGMDFALSSAGQRADGSLSSVRTWWLVVASPRARCEPLHVSVSRSCWAQSWDSAFLTWVFSKAGLTHQLGLARVTPAPWRSGGCEQTRGTTVKRMSHRHWE